MTILQYDLHLEKIQQKFHTAFGKDPSNIYKEVEVKSQLQLVFIISKKAFKMQDLEGMTWFVVIKKLIYLTFLPLLLLFSFERTQKLETVLGSPTFSLLY